MVAPREKRVLASSVVELLLLVARWWKAVIGTG